MPDRLEEFIKENKEQFDSAEPRHAVWEKIDIELGNNKVKKLQPTMWVWKAAVILLIGAVGFLMVDRFNVSSKELAEVSTVQEFKELETFYSSLIAEKRVKIDNEMSSKEFFTFLKADIDEIDAIYEELKETFDEHQETPVVLNALVRLLRQKLHLVSSQLDAVDAQKLKESGVDVGEEDVTSL